jgi:hypothetical protein
MGNQNVHHAMSHEGNDLVLGGARLEQRGGLGGAAAGSGKALHTA